MTPLDCLHECQEPLPADIERHWRRALEDSEIGASSSVLLLLDEDGEDPTMRACYSPAWGEIHHDVPQDRLNCLHESEAHESPRHRVLLWTGQRPIEVSAALLRHELEHARQIQQSPEVYDLHMLSENVVSLVAESGLLYNAMPAERDANAASSAFARRAFGDSRIDELL